MEVTESEGKSVSEAVDSALKKLGLRRDQVEVQILQQASSGFMGLGSKPARVRITEKRWGEPAAPAREPSSAAAANAPQEVGSPPQESLSRAQPSAPQRARDGRQDVRSRSQTAKTHLPAQSEPQPMRAAEAASAVDPRQALSEAQALLSDVLALMGLAQAKISSSWDEAQERLRLSVDSPELESLLGGDGKTLESLQLLLTLMINRRLGSSIALQLDALGYWEKREREALSQAQRGIEEVKSTRKPFRLSPMDAAMRRLVHRSLAGHPDVETRSEGEGSWRKIVIRPRKDR